MKKALVLPALGAVLASCLLLLQASVARAEGGGFQAAVPKTYDDAETATWHVPLARAEVSPTFLPASHFYARKARAIYRSYPVYHPDREPEGYLERLRGVEPGVVWDDAGKRPTLETEADWVRAGELVYDAPIWPRPVESVPHFRDREVLNRVGVPVAADGSLPGVRYVVRAKGQVEVGVFSCATCHTRVLPDGATVKGTQGNLPLARIEAVEIRGGLLGGEADVRKLMDEYHGTPWHPGGPNGRLSELSLEAFARAKEACPPGVYPNHNGGVFSPAHAAELRGVKHRRYLDSTGHMRHRGPADLMRFSDFHQSGSAYAGFGAFRPQPETPPEGQERYSDEQAYALALYVYSLTPPVNPNLPATPEAEARVARGRALFMDAGNRCATCHDPERGYTNDKLTPVDGFNVPAGHPERAHVMKQSVGTDSTLALLTRKGTGFYKVPTLVGVWYRGPFEHNGSVATLEEWFDPARVRDDYVPGGWKGPPGTESRAVRGHEFGLDLSRDDRAALVAFLRTL